MVYVKGRVARLIVLNPVSQCYGLVDAQDLGAVWCDGMATANLQTIPKRVHRLNLKISINNGHGYLKFLMHNQYTAFETSRNVCGHYKGRPQVVISVIRIKSINARLELLGRIAVSHQLTFTLGLR